jgi:acetate kinase
MVSGMTPVEGLMMATRSGDVDPGAVLQMVELNNANVKKVEHELNYNSGMLGIAGTADFRTLVAEAKKGNVRCNLALQMFATRIAKVIGAYWVIVGGADAVVFSGGIGENSAELRKLVAGDLDCLGGHLDQEANLQHKTMISLPNSKFALMVIHTNEELEMAQQARSLICGEQKG